MVLTEINQLSDDEAAAGERAGPTPAAEAKAKAKAKTRAKAKAKARLEREVEVFQPPPSEPQGAVMRRPAARSRSMRRPAAGPGDGGAVPRAYKSMYKRDGIWSLKQYDHQVMTAGLGLL